VSDVQFDDEFPRYEDVLAEVQQELIDGIKEEEGRHGSTRQENFESLVIALNLVAAAKPQRVAGLAAVLALALYDERAIHEKTYSNFEEFAEGAVETRCELEAERERYKLAWTSARRRARALKLSNQVRAGQLMGSRIVAEQYKDERDEARAEVVRLGRKCEELIEENRRLREQKRVADLRAFPDA
jgi:hypothetical protein